MQVLRICLVTLVGVALGGCPQLGENTDGTIDAASYEAEFAVLYPMCQPAADPDAVIAEVLQLVNQERTARGLTELQYSDELEVPAMQHACEMITNHFFAHDNPTTGSSPGDRVALSEFDAVTWGENIACGQATAEEVMTGWMNSDGHRANILNPDFTHLGVGVRTGGTCLIYWVQVFGG